LRRLPGAGKTAHRFQTITDRFASFQAQSFNVHVDFPLLQRLALPLNVGSVRYRGIKIHDTRILRLLEVLLHGGNTVGGWTAKEIYEGVLTTFQLSPKTYGLNQLRYDLRKLKGHGLLQRDGSRYAYRLTPKGVQVALLFLFFHKRLCGPPQTAAFTTLPTRLTHPTANSNLPITKPTRPSRTSSTYSLLRDVTESIVEVFLFKIFDPRIYTEATSLG
jgi:hypothetical protein